MPVTTTIVNAQVGTTTTNRTYGPQPQQPSNNTSTMINSTAAGGIKDMRALANTLEPNTRTYNQTFNDVVLAFAYIQGNITALEKQTNHTIEEAQTKVTQSQTTITQLQRDLDTAKGTLRATQQQLADAQDTTTTTTSSPDEDDGSDNSSDNILENLVDNNNDDNDNNDDGPRTDPEGDGGEGDIDG